MPITHLEVPEVPSLYALRFEGVLAYQDYIGTLQKHLGLVTDRRFRYLAIDLNPLVHVDAEIIEFLRNFQIREEKRCATLYLHVERSRAVQFFWGVLSREGQRHLVIKKDLPTLVAELLQQQHKS